MTQPMIQTVITLGILVLFFLLNVFIAYKKGFNPLIWFLAGGILGLIAILLLPQAKKYRKTDLNEYYKRRKTSNIVGLIIIAIGVTISVLFILKVM